MRQALARRHAEIALRDLGAEQRGEYIHRALRFGAERVELLQPFLVTFDQFRQAQRGLAERLVVRGQHQRGVRHHTFQLGAAVQPVLQRIGLGLGRMHRDIGRDLRQQLVAGDEHVQLRTPQARMLRRMPVAADHAPGVAADGDRVAFDDAVIGAGQAIDAVTEAAEAGAVALQDVFRKSGRAVEAQRLGRRLLAGVGDEVAAHQEFGARDPEFDAELSHQPAGEPDVVGMHVGDDHALDRAALHRPGEELFPGLGRLLVADAAVDHGPAVAIFEQPQIDVVELHRQAHAHPVHAGRHDDAPSGFGAMFEGIVEIAARTDPDLGCAHVRRLSENSGSFDYG